ncbi:MAG TPA: VOC family protein [Rhizomicrobium sp.]|jgi:predicted enzyme related to lactoylglutathione lyase|nr:VOC family protein [Rhizomicrobium sp.]
MARITGVGGIFFKSPDPKALSAWYSDVLGLKMEDWGGAMLMPDPLSPPMLVLSPFAQDTTHFAPSTRDFMINFGVDDLDAYIALLAGKGVQILKREEAAGQGRFAWIMDPDGNKIELWEPER